MPDTKGIHDMFDRLFLYVVPLLAALGMADKPPHFWFGVIGATLYVAFYGSEKWTVRLGKALLSLLLGVAMTPWAMERTGYDEPFVVAMAIIFSLVLIDVVKRVVNDGELVKTIIGFFFGKSSK